MPFSSSNTGSTDLRDTEVQQPKVAATLSTEISWRAFSANSGQFDAGSTTTASNFLPSSPPLAFCCSISISMTSFSVVSLIAMVPDNECKNADLDGAAGGGGRWGALGGGGRRAGRDRADHGPCGGDRRRGHAKAAKTTSRECWFNR